MGNSLRCCLACVLPCGALDVIRIVHLNGYVEEITRPVIAGDVLKNYPNHVLSKPCSDQGVVRRILILSNTSELKRGSIYFLIPASSVPEKKRKPQQKDCKKAADKIKTQSTTVGSGELAGDVAGAGAGGECSSDVIVVSERKKIGHRRARRTVQGGDWRPHLESIFEE